MKKIFVLAALSVVSCGYVVGETGVSAVAFATKDASINMTEIRKSPVFSERYSKLENTYKEILMRLQQEEAKLQEDFKSGRMNEAQVFGKSKELEFEFRNAQRRLQEGVMELEDKVNTIISEITKKGGWDGCVMAFSWANPKRDITSDVVKELESQLKAEESAEKFKQKVTPAPAANDTVVSKSSENGVRPGPKKNRSNASAV